MSKFVEIAPALPSITNSNPTANLKRLSLSQLPPINDKRQRTNTNELSHASKLKKEKKAIDLIRAAARAASKTVASGEFASIFAYAENIIAKRLTEAVEVTNAIDEEPRDKQFSKVRDLLGPACRQLEDWLNDDRGREMWAYIKHRVDLPSRNPARLTVNHLENLRRACEFLTNTSWELCELWNFLLLSRYYEEREAKGPFCYKDVRLTTLYINKVLSLEGRKLNPEDTFPREFFFYEPPSPETLKKFNLVYHSSGLLEPGNPNNSTQECLTPPTFPGEEHLDVIRFYKEGGSWVDREEKVGPIEKKPRYRVTRRNQWKENAPHIPKETLKMREVQGRASGRIIEAESDSNPNSAPDDLNEEESGNISKETTGSAPDGTNEEESENIPIETTGSALDGMIEEETNSNQIETTSSEDASYLYTYKYGSVFTTEAPTNGIKEEKFDKDPIGTIDNNDTAGSSTYTYESESMPVSPTNGFKAE